MIQDEQNKEDNEEIFENLLSAVVPDDTEESRENLSALEHVLHVVPEEDLVEGIPTFPSMLEKLHELIEVSHTLGMMDRDLQEMERRRRDLQERQTALLRDFMLDTTVSE